ncbi:MAG: DUF4249 domain-containing protein [Ginsengibacter sp.]
MKKLLIYIIFFFVTLGCKEKYLPSLTSPATGYLVVEGFISSGPQPTSISLTRTTKLYDATNIIYEHKAIVNIESENHTTFQLFENGNGVYISSSLNLNKNEKYRLQIKTRDNKEYASDFIRVKGTPEIDSISWKRENAGVRIYINTHDPQDATKYYHWKYEETWEIHSAFESTLKYRLDPVTNKILSLVYRNPATGSPDPIFRCWSAENSTNISLGTSEKLSKDLIYLPLLFIGPSSEKLSVLYSIRVKQYALSHEAYLFFEKMKKNTEQVGSIFDPQPSELQGNIHSTSNPAEPVIGYVDISEEKEQRIFISRTQLANWNFKLNCFATTIDNNVDSMNKYGKNLIPTQPVSYMGLAIKEFDAAPDFCVDCTTRGTNIKPAFWP